MAIARTDSLSDDVRVIVAAPLARRSDRNIRGGEPSRRDHEGRKGLQEHRTLFDLPGQSDHIPWRYAVGLATNPRTGPRTVAGGASSRRGALLLRALTIDFTLRRARSSGHFEVVGRHPAMLCSTDHRSSRNASWPALPCERFLQTMPDATRRNRPARTARQAPRLHGSPVP